MRMRTEVRGLSVFDISGRWSVVRDRWHESESGRIRDEQRYEVVVTQNGQNVRMTMESEYAPPVVIKGMLDSNIFSMHEHDSYSYLEVDGPSTGRTTVLRMRVVFSKDGKSAHSKESWMWTNMNNSTDITSGTAQGVWQKRRVIENEDRG
jgi:hypothetical protein